MSKALSVVRASLLAAALATVGWFAATPGMLGGQEWDECWGAGHPDIGPCDPDQAHIYDETCEGTDCYLDLEECCPHPE